MSKLQQRYLNRPLAIQDGQATSLVDFSLDSSDLADDRCYSTVGGIAIIQVYGTLIDKLGRLSPGGGYTGYDGIKAQTMLAMADPMVQGVLYRIDSPGGTVQGCFDLCDFIRAQRGVKPMWAACDEAAYSAAYAIASAADFITVPRTGGVGSVGVIAAHVDMSRALDKSGVTINVIKFGDRKDDGAAHAPLGDEARQRLQADVDAMGNLFAETVASNRGLSKRAVIATQATTFMGSAGVAVGFADAVASYDQTLDLMSHLTAQTK